MLRIIQARVIGNEQAQTLITELEKSGIVRSSIRLIESSLEGEHRDDFVTSRSIGWGAVGAVLGSALGWLIMSWWSLPWIGALWGAVVGIICAARAAGESVADKNLGISNMRSTLVEIASQNRHQTKIIKNSCLNHGAWGIKVTPGF